MASNKFFAFLEEVQQSQRDVEHFKWAYYARNIRNPSGFYFGISDRVTKTPAFVDYSKIEERLIAYGAF